MIIMNEGREEKQEEEEISQISLQFLSPLPNYTMDVCLDDTTINIQYQLHFIYENIFLFLVCKTID